MLRKTTFCAESPNPQGELELLNFLFSVFCTVALSSSSRHDEWSQRGEGEVNGDERDYRTAVNR